MKNFIIKSKFSVARKFPSFFIEFVAVLYGIKPVMRLFGLSENEFKEVEFLCKKYGLYFLFSSKIPPKKKVQRVDSIDNKSVFISKEKELLDKAVYYDIHGPHTAFGDILGYPSCCTTFHQNVTSDTSYDPKAENFLKETYDNTVGKPNYLLNNLLPITLISHFPCSYNCKESIIYAEKVAKALNDFDFRYYKMVCSHLKGNFLFFKEYKNNFFYETTIKFIGIKKLNKIYYNDYLLYHSVDSLSKELIEAVSNCNCAELKGSTLSLSNKTSSFMFELENALMIEFD